MAGPLDFAYVGLVALVTVGGLLTMAYTTKEIRGDRGFALDVAAAAAIAAFILALAWTTVL